MTLLKGNFQRPKLKRPCSRCGEYFIPNTRHTKLCPKCYDKARSGKSYKKRKVKNE